MANININERDWQKIYKQGPTGVPAPNQAAGLLGLLAQQQNKPVSTAPFNPMLTGAEMIDPNRMNPYATGRYNGTGQPGRPSVTQQTNPMEAIMSQLAKLMEQSPPQIQFDPVELPSFDPNKFKGQATEIVNEQFNPIINDLLNQQKSTQTRAKGNQKAVGDMYNQLASYLGQESATTNKGYDQAQAESKTLYTDERDKIAGMYAADAAAQRAEAKRLGTEAFGTPDAIAQQNADKQFADQMASQQMQSTQTAYGQQQQAAGDFDRAMQGAARSEGGEAQQDIIRQLEDYMTQSDTNLAETRSQQAGSISDLMMKLAQGTYDRDLQNAQFGYQQQRDYIGDQNQLYDRNLDLQLKQLELMQAATGANGTSSEKLNPWQSVAQFSEQLQPGQGQNIVAALQQAMNERPEIYARSKEDPVPMTPALFAKLIGDSQAAGSLDQNALRMAAQELYRLLYGM
jgi:hypothetical protein